MGESFVEQKLSSYTVVTFVGQPAKTGYNLSKIASSSKKKWILIKLDFTYAKASAQVPSLI